MLKCVNTEEGDPGGIAALVIDANYATRLAWTIGRSGGCVCPPQIRIYVIYRNVRLLRIFAVRAIGTDVTALPQFKEG